MKKIFVLAFSLVATTAVFAQRGYDRRDESRDIVLGQPNNRNVYGNDRSNNGYYSTRERDVQIQRINREYDRRIDAVKYDRYLRKAEKKRQIRFLENERDARIREVVQRYNDYNRDNRTSRRY